MARSALVYIFIATLIYGVASLRVTPKPSGLGWNMFEFGADCVDYSPELDVMWGAGVQGSLSSLNIGSGRPTAQPGGQYIGRIANFSTNQIATAPYQRESFFSPTCSFMQFVPQRNSLVICAASQIAEYDPTTLALIGYRSPVSVGASIVTCAIDVSRNRLYALEVSEIEENPASLLYSYSINATSGLWQVEATTDLAALYAGCAALDSRQMVLGLKFGYVTCESSPIVVRWNLETGVSEGTIATTRDPPIGFGDASAMAFDAVNKHLLIASGVLRLALLYRADEDTEDYTLLSIFSTEPYPVTAIAIDTTNKVGLWGFDASQVNGDYSKTYAQHTSGMFQTRNTDTAFDRGVIFQPALYANKPSARIFVLENKNTAIVVGNALPPPGGAVSGWVTFLDFVVLHECQNFSSSCGSCLGSNDFNCGWCLERIPGAGPDGHCASSRECTSFQLEQNVCPVLTYASPPSASTVGGRNTLLYGGGFIGEGVACVYSDPSEVVATAPVTVIDPVGLVGTCVTPSVANSGTYNLTVVRGNSPLTAFRFPGHTTVTRYDCSSFTTCSNCTSTAHPECAWCSFDATCGASLSGCPTPDSPIISSLSAAKCPVLSGISPISTLTPVPVLTSLRLNVSGLFAASIALGYQCEFGFNTPLLTSGTYDETNNQLVCSVPVPTQVTEVPVRVLFRGREFASNSRPFLYYECSAFTNCSTCVTTAQSACGWCLATRTCQVSTATCSDMVTSSCPAISTTNPVSIFRGATTTLALLGGPFTDTDAASYECEFQGKAPVAATRVSRSELTCPAPVENSFPGSRLVTPTRVLHVGAPYTDYTGVTYYDCTGSVCSDCVGDLTPQCSYCISTGVCGLAGTLGSCSTLESITCPAISNVSPAASSVEGGITATVTGAFISGLNYMCTFDAPSLGLTRVVGAYVNPTTLLCHVPAVNMTNSGAGTLSVELDLGSSMYSDYSSNSLPFLFVVCMEQISCGACVAAPQCSWCDYNRCESLSSAPSCPIGLLNSTTQCPVVNSISPDHSQLDDEALIVFSGSNFLEPTGGDRLFCNWGGYFRTPAKVDSPTSISCVYKVITAQAITLGDVGVQLETQGGHLYSSSVAIFNIYDCKTTTSHCGVCATNPSPYCGWCLSTYECIDEVNCGVGFWTAQTCPTIATVTPSFSLITGGSSISVSGSFLLTSETSEFDISCAFGNTVTNATLVSDSEIVCEAPSASKGRTSLRIVHNNLNQQNFTTNTANFDFIDCQAPACAGCFSVQNSDPRCSWCVYDGLCSTSDFCSVGFLAASVQDDCPSVLTVVPASGPLVGGSVVSITGTNFVNSSELQCSFGGIVSPAVFVSDTQVTCTSPPAAEGTAEGDTIELVLMLRGASFTLNSLSFQYQNPDGISGLTPGQVALYVVLILLALAIVAAVVVAIIIRRRTSVARENRKFLKLRTPQFEKVVFAYNADLDYELSAKDIERLKPLENLLAKDKQFVIATWLASVMNVRDLEPVSKALMYFYQTKSLTLELMINFVNSELDATSEGTLFRATSVACKIFNHFAKYIGMPYLWLHLAFFINQLHEFGKEERRDDRESILGPGTMEVDPDRDLDEDEAPIDEVDIRLNQYELLLRASKLLKSILKSPTELPPEFRVLAKHVKESVASKFPTKNSDYKAVGNFLFLRFICPSIMAPQVYGLLDEPPNETSQRYFVLLAKTLQNLANETLPGAKEEYMAKLNEFITKNIEPLHQWVDQVVSIDDESQHAQGIEIPDQLKYSCLAVLQRAIVDQLDDLKTTNTVPKATAKAVVEAVESNGTPGNLKKKKKHSSKKGNQ